MKGAGAGGGGRTHHIHTPNFSPELHMVDTIVIDCRPLLNAHGKPVADPRGGGVGCLNPLRGFFACQYRP